MSNRDRIIAQFEADLTGLSRARPAALKLGREVGADIAGALDEGFQDNIQQFASQLPGLGGAVGRLAGSVGALGGAVTAVAGVFAFGTLEAAKYQQELFKLDAVLRATGNNTAFSRGEIAAFAEEVESATGVAAESILQAAAALSTFDGIAGPAFTKTITLAADMSATFGGDLSSNAETLGRVLQNLAGGSVEGLDRAFKFLSPSVRQSIEDLAEAGKGVAAQDALFKALEERVGGSAAGANSGLTGAFGRLGDALGDTARDMAEGIGAVSGLTAAIGGLADELNRANDQVQQSGGWGEYFKKAFNVLDRENVVLDALLPRNFFDPSKRIGQTAPENQKRTTAGGNEAPLNAERLRQLERERQVAEAQAAAEESKAKEKAKDAAEKAADAAKRQAEQRARAAQQAAAEDARREAALRKLIEGMEREGQLARMTAEARAAALAYDRARETAGRDLTLEETRRIGMAGLDKDLGKATTDWQDGVNKTVDDELAKRRRMSDESADYHFEQWKKAQDEAAAQAREQFRSLSDAFYDGMTTGGKSFWGSFENLGKRILADMAASFVMEAFGKGGGTATAGSIGGLGGLLDGLFGKRSIGTPPYIPGQAGGDISIGRIEGSVSKLTGSFDGFMKKLGGLGDSMGGRAVLGFGANELVKLFGGKGNSTGSAIGSQAGGMIGKMIPIPGVSSVLSFAGGIIGGLFKKDDWADITLSTGATGKVGTSGLRSRGDGRAEQAESMAGAVSKGLDGIIEALGGSLRSGATIGSIGTNKDTFYFDPQGRNNFRVSGIQKFTSAEDAVEAAIKNAVSTGIVQGLTAEARKLLTSTDDLEGALNALTTAKNIADQLAEASNPIATAVEGINEEFDKASKLLRQFGLDVADAEKLRARRVQEAIEQGLSQQLSGVRGVIADLTKGNLAALTVEQRFAQTQSDFRAGLARQDISGDELANLARQFADANADFNASSEQRFAIQDMITRELRGYESRVTAEANALSKPVTKDDLANTVTAGDRVVADTTADGFELLSQQFANWTAQFQQWLAQNGSGGVGPAVPALGVGRFA